MTVTPSTSSEDMKRVLGGFYKLNNGVIMPRIGLGTAYNEDQGKINGAVRAAFENGYRLIDTAANYKNEDMIGKALKDALPSSGLSREDIFLTTKVGVCNEDSVAHVGRTIDNALKALGSSYLDLVLIHYPRDRFTGTDDDESNAHSRRLTWQALEDIYEKDKVIRAIGVSNYEVYHLAELFEYARVVPAVNQCEFHPFATQKLLRHYCKLKGITFQAFSSLAWGNAELMAAPVLQQLADKYGVSKQNILFAFGMASDAGILPKSESPSRVRTNIVDTLKLNLTEEEVKALSELNRNQVFCPTCEMHKVI